ncbi:MAG: hypothetical protein RMI83_02495 [Desulfurococcaceae archaeon]|nr:hypothetical protein [Sulfolobales archaeon]MDW8169955.1 hypothetical protein [Desulfurococcaceae archaeon]
MKKLSEKLLVLEKYSEYSSRPNRLQSKRALEFNRCEPDIIAFHIGISI